MDNALVGSRYGVINVIKLSFHWPIVTVYAPGQREVCPPKHVCVSARACVSACLVTSVGVIFS